MRVYKIESIPRSLLAGGAFLLFGLLGLLYFGATVSYYGLLYLGATMSRYFEAPVSRYDPFWAVIIAPLSALLCYLAWSIFGQCSYEVLIADTCQVEFARLVGTLGVEARDITSIEQRFEKAGRFSGDDDDDLTEACIEHRGGTICVPYFSRAEEMITDLLALNPGIDVRGTWPTPDSRPPSGEL